MDSRARHGAMRNRFSTTRQRTRRLAWPLVLVALFWVAAASVSTAAAAGLYRVQLAQVGGDAVNVDIVTECRDNRAIFKVVNTGDAWPKQGVLGVYMIRADGTANLIAKRSMRLINGQRASFRVRTKGAGQLAMFIAPSWYQRDFQYDASVECR